MQETEPSEHYHEILRPTVELIKDAAHFIGRAIAHHDPNNIRTTPKAKETETGGRWDDMGTY